MIAIAALLAAAALSPAAGVDPRTGGFEVGMGEWTVTAEAAAIRPGAVTFVVTNRGRFGHGFRIRDRGDGRGDRFEVRTRVLRPGETVRVTVELAAGTYDLECFVEDQHGDHEDRGMHTLLSVRADAPLVQRPKPAAGVNVRIERFAYKPALFRAKVGQTVRWRNYDAAPHTVSALNGSFTSKQLGRTGTYARRFTKAGTYAYLCAIHPQMKARVVVSR